MNLREHVRALVALGEGDNFVEKHIEVLMAVVDEFIDERSRFSQQHPGHPWVRSVRFEHTLCGLLAESFSERDFLVGKEGTP